MASSVSAISRNCCGSSRPPRAARPDPRLDVVRRADAHAGPVLEQRPGLVRLVEAAADDDRVARTARAPRRGGATARTTSSRRAARGPAGNSRSAIERASIARSRGRPADRRAARDDEPPRDRRPGLRRRRRSRSGASATIPGRGSPSGADSRRSGDAGSHRSSAGVTAGRCRTPPPRGRGRRRGAHRGCASERRRGRPCTPPSGRAPRARRASRRRPSIGSTARTSSAAGRAAGSVTTLRQWCIP